MPRKRSKKEIREQARREGEGVPSVRLLRELAARGTAELEERRKLDPNYRQRSARPKERLARGAHFSHDASVEPEPLIHREELTATLFAIADLRQDVAEIRDWLKEERDGEEPKEES